MNTIKYIFAAIIVPFAISCNNNESTTDITEATEDHTEHTKDTAKSPFAVMMDKSMQEMMQMKMTNDPDHDFAAMMKMHHQSAVEMAQHVLQNGQDTVIKGMAQTMITNQKQEIEEFDKFLSSHQPAAAKEEASKDLMKAMHNHMDPAEPLNNNTDHDFVAMMIAHHKSAVEMSESIVKSGKEKPMKTMATKNYCGSEKGNRPASKLVVKPQIKVAPSQNPSVRGLVQPTRYNGRNELTTASHFQETRLRKKNYLL